ncbi:MAG: hypothetical protein ABSB82_01715 [Terriglobia bacterium]|jgi:hypothetical protein
MKMKTALGALVFLLSVLWLGAPTIGQQQPAVKKGTVARPQAKAGINKQTVLTPKAQPCWPHVVVLDLTDAQYQEFKKDPVAFDKKYNVFPDQHIVGVVSYVELPPSSGGPPTAGAQWTVTITHGKPSQVGIVAGQQEP